MLLEPLSNLQNISLFILRLALGFIMVVHGFPKLAGPSRQPMREAMAQIGVPKPLFDLVGIIEVVGGFALIVGFLTQIVALLFLVQMIGTIGLYLTKLGVTVPPPEMLQQMVTISRKVLRGFVSGVGGWEFDLLILGVAVLLMTTGAGSISIDAVLGF